MIERYARKHTEQLLHEFPAVAMLGPRQVGKTALAREISDYYSRGLYLDLESPIEHTRLSEPEEYFERQKGKRKRRRLNNIIMGAIKSGKV
ncbi:MAG: AAA family ATPase [Chitinophagaceae bacterium]